MKKLLTATIATLMVCSLAACGGGNNKKSTASTGGPEGKITYDFSGAEESAVQNSQYNVFEGVSVITNTGVELKTRTTATSDCGITNKLLNTSEVRTCKIDYTVTYKINDVSITETASRNVEIVAPTVQAGNLVSNPMFELGTTDWELATHEGGSGEFSVEKVDVNGENKNAAKVVMTGLNSTNDSSPRLNSATYATNGNGEDKRFDMLGGQNYKVSFKAKALTTKYVNVAIGQLFPTDPYYEAFTSPEQVYTAEITNEWKTFEFTFTATHANLDDCSILFSMGRVKPTADVMTTLWYTDVYVGVYSGEVSDDKAPAINGVNDSKVTTSSTPFNLLTGITATDNVDGDITGNIKAYLNNQEITTLDVKNPGTYTITYKVSDAAGNEGTATRVITVVAAGANLLDNIDAARVKADSWCATEWITQSITADGDAIKVVTNGHGDSTVVDQNGNQTQGYVNQININNLPCVSGNSYTLTFEVKTSVAFKARFIQNQNPYTEYASVNCPVSNDFTTVTMVIPAAEFDTNNKFTIELGLVATKENPTLSFWLKDFKLVQN